MASKYKPRKQFRAKAQIVLGSLVFDRIFDVEIYWFCQNSERLKPIIVCREVQSMRGG